MNRKQLHYDDDSNLIMDEHNISLICEQEGLYEFPELNKKLYLNNKNFIKIDNLSKYINIKVLYLCYNRISKLENLKGLDSL
jgi:Leucine-rich repeat (LRR) protein